MAHRHSCKLAALAIIVMLTGCSSDEMYRGDFTLCDYNQPGDCAGNALQEHSTVAGEEDYRLGFIEYDDQGQLRDPGQMNAVLDEYRRIAGLDDVLLITFVHGWHHSAQPEDSNIASFRKLLAQVSKTESAGSKQQGRNKRRILGLYIGWRGDSVTVPYINGLTFWDRKNTAHNVGQQGITEALLKLEEIVNVKMGIEEVNPPPIHSRLVVIGHSFGGAVVYTALHKILVDRFINSKPEKTVQGNADGFGDLVVLVNPAFEALRFATLYDLSQEACRVYFKTQLPKLAVLTSESDYATRYAFPAGRFFSTLFESHLTLDRHYCSAPGRQQATQIDEGSADRTTVGHFTPYQTHHLLPAEVLKARGSDYQVAQIQSAWSAQGFGDTLVFEGSRLESLGRTDPLNPYLNIKVDSELMIGHNDIWGEGIVSFVRDLIVISTTPGNSGTK